MYYVVKQSKDTRNLEEDLTFNRDISKIVLKLAVVNKSWCIMTQELFLLR